MSTNTHGVRSGPAMPLNLAGSVQDVELVQVCGGKEFVNRMMEMGLVPGSRLQVESGNMRGPVVVVVKGVRLALGHGMAHRVLVRPVNS